VGEQYQIGDNSADNDNQDGPFDDFQSVGMALRDVVSLLKPIHYFSALLLEPANKFDPCALRL
jgi:hypothetical protein